MILAKKKETHRSMKQNREPRNKPMQINSSITRKAKIYNGNKTVFLISSGCGVAKAVAA